MTGMLDDLLRERADEAGSPHLDLAAITRDGERRVRRRRTLLGGGVAAAAAVAVLAGTSLLGGTSPSPDSGQDLVADGTDAAPVALSWTEGSVLHRLGQPDADLGVDVRAWVWAGDAVVFTDPQHRVRLWTGDALDVVGTSATPPREDAELVADGSFAAWSDTEGRLVRLDAATGETVTSPTIPGSGVRVTAIDGSQVYAASSAGVYAWQPTAPDSYRLLGDDPEAVVLDAEGGTLVRATPGGGASVERGRERVQVPTDEFANLSPDGRLISVEDGDAGRLLEIPSGVERPLTQDHEWAIAYQWLDGSSLAVMAFDGIDDDATMTGVLTTCSTDGACGGPEQDLPPVGEFQLPIGTHFTS